MERKCEGSLTPKSFIFHYVIPLFTAALLLVLFSYYNESRLQNAHQTIDDLGDRLTEKQREAQEYSQKYERILDSLQTLQSDYEQQSAHKTTLNEQLTQQADEIRTLQQALDEANASLKDAQARLSVTETLLALEQSMAADNRTQALTHYRTLAGEEQLKLLSDAQRTRLVAIAKELGVNTPS